MAKIQVLDNTGHNENYKKFIQEQARLLSQEWAQDVMRNVKVFKAHPALVTPTKIAEATLTVMDIYAAACQIFMEKSEPLMESLSAVIRTAKES